MGFPLQTVSPVFSYVVLARTQQQIVPTRGFVFGPLTFVDEGGSRVDCRSVATVSFAKISIAQTKKLNF